MNQISIRKAGGEDSKAVAAIGRITFEDTWHHMNTEDDLKNYMAEAFDESKIKKDLGDDSFIFLIAEIGPGYNTVGNTNKRTIGYAKMRMDRPHEEFKGSRVIEIERMYVLKDYHGQKVGKSLMDECIRIAREGHYEWLWLGVYPQNFKAMKFYQLYGFSQFGSKVFKLGDAEDIDILVKKDLREKQ